MVDAPKVQVVVTMDTSPAKKALAEQVSDAISAGKKMVTDAKKVASELEKLNKTRLKNQLKDAKAYYEDVKKLKADEWKMMEKSAAFEAKQNRERQSYIRKQEQLQSKGNMRINTYAGLNIGGAQFGLMSEGINPGLIALNVGAGLLKTAFSELYDATKQTVSAFIGAVAEIGGARGLQQMLVESSNTERTAANLANNSLSGWTTKESMAMINRLSGNSEFNPNEIGQMARGFVGKTGDLAGFNRLGSFATDIASVSGMGADETGRFLGQIKTEFPGLDDAKLKQAAMNMWGLGRSGSVELKDAADISRALGFATKAGNGDITKGLNFEMGITQLAQKFTGGLSSAQAVTSVKSVQEQLLQNKSGKFSGVFGDYITTNKQTGEAEFKDAAHLMAKAALLAFEHPDRSPFDKRSNAALYGIASAGQKEFTGDPKHDIAVLEKLMKGFENGEVTINEFTGAVERVKDTVDYQLKKAFNDVSTSLQGTMLNAVKTFSSVLIDNKDALISSIKAIIDMFTALIPVTFSFGKYMLALTEILEPIIPGLNKDDLAKVRTDFYGAMNDYNSHRHGHDIAEIAGMDDKDFRKLIIKDIEKQYPSLVGNKSLEEKPLSDFSEEEVNKAFTDHLQENTDALNNNTQALLDKENNYGVIPNPLERDPNGNPIGGRR